METELTTIVGIAPGRLIGLAADGTTRLVWDNAMVRLPLFELPHVLRLIDQWCADEEPGLLRRGYYRLLPSPDGGVQLWLNNVGLLLSRDEVRQLFSLLSAAADELCHPLCRQRHDPLGLGFRSHNPAPLSLDQHN